MKMNDHYYDDMLNIKTCGEQKGFTQSFHYHRYEPTPYHALETLFQQCPLSPSHRVVDFGCGKGRLNFFINHLFQIPVVGIEMNEDFYQDALDNRERYFHKNKNSKRTIDFHCCLAEEYKIDPSDNYFYFFNPFSIQIFRRIVNNILVSVESNPREVHLVLYYVSGDYIFFLENQTSFELDKEVVLPDLYERNPNERFLIYRLGF